MPALIVLLSVSAIATDLGFATGIIILMSPPSQLVRLE